MEKAPFQFEERRQAKRFKLDNSGILYDAKVYRYPIKLIDVSTTGMKIGGLELEVDEQVIFEWDETDIHSVVVWSKGEVAGLAFDDPLTEMHPLLKLGNSPVR